MSAVERPTIVERFSIIKVAKEVGLCVETVRRIKLEMNDAA
jgi:hypothetical protein